jgi:hypothetical protein
MKYNKCDVGSPIKLIKFLGSVIYILIKKCQSSSKLGENSAVFMLIFHQFVYTYLH